MLTYVIFSLILTIGAGIAALMIKGPLVPIIFFVSLALFVWSGLAYLGERRRGSRR